MSTTASSIFSAYASVATFMMLFRSVASELVPAPFRSYIDKAINYLFAPIFSRDLTLIVDELSGMTRNQVYDSAELYLWTKIGPHTERLRVSKASWKKNIGVAIDKDEEVSDTFDAAVKLKWRFITDTKKGKNDRRSKRRYFELTFHKKHMDKVISSYLPYILTQADAIKAEEKVVKLYTRHLWSRYDDDDVANSEWGLVDRSIFMRLY